MIGDGASARTRGYMRRLGATSAIALVALAACSSARPAVGSSSQPAPAGVTVEGSWASSAGTVANVYFLLANGSPTSDRLLGASSPLAAQAAITDGSRTIRSLRLPAGSQLSFDGTRYALVLTGLRKRLAPGEVLEVTLNFAHAGPVTFDAGVR